MEALHCAGKHGHAGELERLLADGVEIEAKTPQGWTALHVAGSEGFEDLVDLLLRQGANVDALTAQDATPLHLAVEGRHLKVAGLLASQACKNKVNNTLIFAGLEDNNAEPEKKNKRTACHHCRRSIKQRTRIPR